LFCFHKRFLEKCPSVIIVSSTSHLGLIKRFRTKLLSAGVAFALPIPPKIISVEKKCFLLKRQEGFNLLVLSKKTTTKKPITSNSPEV